MFLGDNDLLHCKVTFALSCEILFGGLLLARNFLSHLEKGWLPKEHLQVDYLECGTHFPIKKNRCGWVTSLAYKTFYLASYLK